MLCCERICFADSPLVLKTSQEGGNSPNIFEYPAAQTPSRCVPNQPPQFYFPLQLLGLILALGMLFCLALRWKWKKRQQQRVPSHKVLLPHSNFTFGVDHDKEGVRELKFSQFSLG